MDLTLSLFGSMEISWAGQSLSIAPNAGRALLAYLALEGKRPHPREMLASLLWPDQSQAGAYANLRQTLARVRKAFPADAAASLTVTTHSVQFNRDVVTVDVIRFDELLAECAAHAHSALTACEPCLKRLQAAAALYRGELLNGLFLPQSQPFEEWLLLKREMLHRQALNLLHTLTRASQAAGDYTRMYEYAARQLALEPWREEAHMDVMRALAYTGQRSAALAQYETCSRVLEQELGIEPSAETRALYDRILAGELVPTTLTTPAPPHNLPAQLSPFVGRESELVDIDARLQQPDVRLLTLVGAGGMGKTRLALEAARALLHLFPDGVFFVGLASVTAASEIAPAIADAIGLRTHGDPRQAVLQVFRDKQVLLLLDNFEHMLEGVEFIIALLHAAPQLQLVVTSREQLNVRGEHLFFVQPMEYAPEVLLADGAASAAVRLFMQSARRVLPTFDLSATNLESVQRICGLVHGVPLALELAASWTEVLPLAEIATEIEHSADFLATEWRDAPERQRSMRAVFDWSWALLSDGERQVFRQLAVFRGGFTREAAQSVVGAPLRILTKLMHKSLLYWSEIPGKTGRYEIHELLRQFAAHSLDAVPDQRAAVEARHSHYYLAFVVARERRLSRDEPNTAAAEIQREIGNIRVAWWRAVHDRQIGALAESAGGLWQFLRLVGPISEWREPLSAAIEQAQIQGDRTSAEPHSDANRREHSKLLGLFGSLCIQRGLHEQALAAADEAIALGQVSQGPEGETRGYLVKGQALRRLGLSAEGQTLLEQAAATAHAYRRAGVSAELLADTEYLAYNWLCSIALTGDDYSSARRYVDQGLELCQSLGKRIGEMGLHTDLIDIAIATGDYATASHHCEAALGMARALGYTRGEAIVQVQQGELARLRGDHGQAQRLISAALERSQIHGDMVLTTMALGEMVRLGLFVGDYPAAKEWFVRLQAIIEGAETAARETLQCNLIGAELALAIDNGMEALRHADQSYHLAQQLDGRASQANALVLLGAARSCLGQVEDAAAAYEQALDLYSQLGLAHKAIEARAGLAQIALGRGASAEAMAQAEMILPILEAREQIGSAKPFALYLTCYQALAASHDPRAANVLAQARQMLLRYGERITNDVSRRSFLQGVETNRVLLYELHED